MYAARAQLLEEVVRPALARGEVVVSDRYNTASFAYQGYGRELGTATVRAFDRVICGTTQPDLTIILDLDPEHALGRALGRGTQQSSRLDRIEAQGLALSPASAGRVSCHRPPRAGAHQVGASQPIDRGIADARFARSSSRFWRKETEIRKSKLENRDGFRVSIFEFLSFDSLAATAVEFQ